LIILALDEILFFGEKCCISERINIPVVFKAFQVHTHAWCNPNNRETWGESNEKESLLDAVWCS
jgi:hypothetical protein